MSKSLKILVVDDDRDHADTLAELFELEDHDVEVAYSGADAIAAFKRSDFDIAFLDVMMPNMNGVESFFKIRQVKPDANVIMMTGYSVEELIKQATKNGAIGVLHKPLSPQSVVDALDSISPSGVALLSPDDDATSNGVEDVIAQNGKTCTTINTKIDAGTKIETVETDAVVLDYDAPLIDYLYTYYALQKSSGDIPAIFVTQYADQFTGDDTSNIDWAQLGILSKPYEPDQLLSQLESLSGSKTPSGA